MGVLAGEEEFLIGDFGFSIFDLHRGSGGSQAMYQKRAHLLQNRLPRLAAGRKPRAVRAIGEGGCGMRKSFIINH